MRPDARASLTERSSIRIRKLSLRHLVCAFIASALIAPIGYAQSKVGTHALETRAKEVARAISTGQSEDLTRLVHESFGGNLRNIPMPAHMGMLMSYGIRREV